MFASKARKEGLLQVSQVFLETAEQELEHAEWFMKMFLEIKEKEGLDIEMQKVDTDVFVKLGTTLENLKYAIDGETYEFDDMYAQFVEDALEE